MYKGKRFAVVMPAYNAEKTLRMSYDEVATQGVADTIIIVDDCSSDAIGIGCFVRAAISPCA